MVGRLSERYPELRGRMLLATDHPETIRLVAQYLERLSLPSDQLRLTTDRATYARWLGRRVEAAIGGAYAYLPKSGEHAILINLARIDLSRPMSLEIVVGEELVHMRDRLDGDTRRHAKHGHDRIAIRVAALTGTSLDDVRAALLPRPRRRLRYLYECPTCRTRVERRLRGTWSCGRCARRFDPRHTLRLIEDRGRAERRRTAAQR